MAMSVADMPRDIFKAVSKIKKETESRSVSGKGSKQASQTASQSTSDLASRDASTTTLPLTEDPATLGFVELSAEGDDRYSMTSVTVTSASEDQETRHGSSTDLSALTSASTPPRTRHDMASHTAITPKTGEASKNQARPEPESKPSATAINFGSAMEAGRGISNIVTTGAKTPMNFCLGLARGFRNAPKLYNDDTVRPQEKVTGLASGLKVAGKEFGFGLFDGITGLITQPMRGAEKEGGVGLIKGIGKGIGGLVLKPSSGKALPSSFSVPH